MKLMQYLPVLLVLVSAEGCSTQYAYDVLQISQRARCSSVPPSEYDECVQRHSESYGKYQQKRDEATQP